MREGEAQGLDGLMAEMTACERERQQTDQPMCHIAPSLSVHYALLSLFRLLPLTCPLSQCTALLMCSLSSFSFLCFSPTPYLFTPLLLQLLSYQHHFAPFLAVLHLNLNALFSLNALLFPRILSPSIPVTPCHSRLNYYSWMEHRLSGAVLCSLHPHYPFIEYPLLW